MKNTELENSCFRFTEKLLYNYKEMESHINNLEDLLNKVKSEDYLTVRAITYDDIKTSPTYKISNTVRDGVIDVVKVVQEIEIDLYHELSIKKKIDKAINNLKPIRKQIIELRYNGEMGWTEMAQELYHDEKTLRKYKNQAVKSIAIELFGSKVFKEEEPTLFDMIVI